MKNLCLENDLVLFEYRDGILYGQYKVTEIDLATAKAVTALRQEFTGGYPMPAIADISTVKQVPKDTREFFSSIKAGEDLAALAVVVNNPVTRTMGNFFLKFHQPKYPFRLFTNLDEATLWIKQFI